MRKKTTETPSRRLNFRGGQRYNEYFSTPNFGTESILWRFFFHFDFCSLISIKIISTLMSNIFHFGFCLNHTNSFIFSPRILLSLHPLFMHTEYPFEFFLEFECVNAHKLFGFSLQNDNKTYAFKFHFCSFKEKKQHTKLFFGFSPLVFILLYRNIYT